MTMPLPHAPDISVPDVSVIVPVYNDAGLLEGCLRALEMQRYAGTYEIIVIDNSERFSLADFAERFPQVHFLWEPTPGSYAARNLGIAHATGALFAFTDADCLPHPDWLEQGTAVLLADVSLGLVGGRVAVVPVSSSIAALFDMVTAFPQRMYIERGRFAVTANMMTRRLVVERIGPFDATLKSSGDKDFGERTARAGYHLAYAEGAVVEHPARESAGEIFRKLRRSVGGSRDRDPGWRACLGFATRFAVPPRRAIWRALTLPDARLTIPRRFGIVGFCVLANWVRSLERVRLQFSKAASTRE